MHKNIWVSILESFLTTKQNLKRFWVAETCTDPRSVLEMSVLHDGLACGA